MTSLNYSKKILKENMSVIGVGYKSDNKRSG